MIEKGCLYIVATPIGNLEDITQRAITVLSEVDAIAAEDTRQSKKLTQHLGIDTPLFAFHEHNEKGTADSIIKRLVNGEAIALISDAGTPLISDPGYILVRQARIVGVKVIPVPGPSSILAALSCSGLPTDRFVFEGFLPAKTGARQKRLNELSSEKRTLVLFEAPHRIMSCLKDIEKVLGRGREIVLARELTKSYETFLQGPVKDVLEQVERDSNQERGEIVLLLSGSEKKDELDAQSIHVLSALLEELPLNQASVLAAKITGLGKKVFYQYGLELKERD